MNNNNSNYNLSQQEVKYITLLLKNSSKQQLDFINHMIDRDNNFQEIFESQTSISKRINVPRRSVSRLSTTVSQKGLVIKKSRGRNGLLKNTCEYILPEIWDDPDIRQRYKHILPALQIKKRYSSIQSVKNSKYLSYKIIQAASVAYINIPSCIISLNSVHDGTNMHDQNEHGNCKSKNMSFQNEICSKQDAQKKRRNMENEKGFNEVAQKYLEAYPKEAVKYATRKIQGRTLSGDAWLYYKKILNEWCSTNNMEPDYNMLNEITGIPRLILPIPRESVIAQPTHGFKKQEEKKEPNRRMPEWKSQPVEVKLKSAVEMACQVADFIEKQQSNPIFTFALKGLLDYEYQLTGEPNEEAAFMYIKSKREKYCQKQEEQPIEQKPKEEDRPLSGREKILALMKAIPKSVDDKFREYGVTTTFAEPDLLDDHASLFELRPTSIELPKIQEPTKLIAKNNIYTVAALPVTSEFEPGSITINEMDYDEVLD